MTVKSKRSFRKLFPTLYIAQKSIFSFVFCNLCFSTTHNITKCQSFFFNVECLCKWSCNSWPMISHNFKCNISLLTWQKHIHKTLVLSLEALPSRSLLMSSEIVPINSLNVRLHWKLWMVLSSNISL